MESEITFIAVFGYPNQPGITFGLIFAVGKYMMQPGGIHTVEELRAMGCEVFGLSIVPLP